MRVLLVRHAVALRRSEWAQADRLRPLAPRGLAQAGALAGQLGPYDVRRVMSSPWLRCLETVAPLASSLGLEVEEEPLLGEGNGPAAAHLAHDAGPGSLVMCTHGDVLPALLGAVADVGRTADLPCGKGATWVVEDMGDEGRRRAIYLTAPA